MTLLARGAMITAMAKDPSWHGRLRIEGYVAWWSGSVGDTVLHRHFAAQAVFSDTPVALLDGNGARVEGRCLLIEPDAPHRLLPSAAAELCYVEPTVAFGPPDTLRARIPANARIVPGGRESCFWESWMVRAAPPEMDRRIETVLNAIDKLLPLGAVRLADVGWHTPLSTGRLRHLFSSETGMPFQRYILWRRMRVAFERLLGGSDITAAAHDAGFADAAHFARTIKATFGIRAGDIFRTS
ncbi:helix-turn-helix transcriptional regulator [Sphingopyxis sp.]|uniref:helix-turn-helix transcriptional regulator n=1 Tax=Sphingopyxis sp. TaxID=1908224 RepID=UPI002ED8F792